MKLTTTGKKVIEEVPWGIYLWWDTRGEGYVGDDAGHYLMIASTKGDTRKIEELRKAAQSYGIMEGYPVYMSGHRPVTDEEYAEQEQRMKWGLTPDPLDVAAINEDARNANRKRR